MYNTADRKEIRKAEKAAKIAERQRRDVISGLMSSNPGRAWMLEILERCHLFQTSFDTNAAITAFREGERNIGAQFLSDIMRACPDQFMLMMRERNERDIARDAASNNAAAANGADDTNDDASYIDGAAPDDYNPTAEAH